MSFTKENVYMKLLVMALLFTSTQLYAFDLPVAGIGKSGKRHEAYDNMRSWCDRNNGVIESHICRKVDSEMHCSYNTYICSGICKVGEDQ